MQVEEPYPQPERCAQENSAQWAISYGELSRIRQEIESLNHQLDLQEIYNKLIGFIKSGHREVKDSSMVCLAMLFRKGHSPDFLRCEDAAGSLIKYFNVLSRELQALNSIGEELSEASKVEGRLLGVLSAFSQLLHDSPTWSLPLSKRFVLNLFKLSPQLVAASPLRREITKVLSVIWLAVSRQIKFLKETSLVSGFKQLLLRSYSLAEEQRTLTRFNAALKNIIKESPLTAQEVQAHSLLPIFIRLLSREQLQEVNVALKLKVVCRESPKGGSVGSK